MPYSNAYKGVKKIFSAQIISLIGTAVLLLFSIISIFVLAAVNNGSSVSSPGPGSVLNLLIPVCSGVLVLVCFILELIGVIQAKADEPSFIKALIFLIVSFVLNLLSIVFPNNSIVRNIFSVISTAVGFAATLFIVRSIQVLARKLARDDVERNGRVFIRLFLISTILVLVTGILLIFAAAVSNSVLTSITNYVAPLSGILTIVASIVYLVFLRRAVRMLEA